MELAHGEVSKGGLNVECCLHYPQAIFMGSKCNGFRFGIYVVSMCTLKQWCYIIFQAVERVKKMINLSMSILRLDDLNVVPCKL